ncbi:MAG: ABC transporter permease [Alphaproteobacteria bacterium]|nr:ABC transporter permease [Alphaproteobacteria bacterium]
MFELKEVNNEHVVFVLEDSSMVSDFIVDEQIISNWKIDNKVVYIELSSLETKYSSLLGAKIRYIVKHFRELGFKVDINRLPKEIKDIIVLSFKKTGNEAPKIKNTKIGIFEKIGFGAINLYKSYKNVCDFIKSSFEAVINFFGGTAIFRQKDFWFVFEECSYKAVGIISLVSFLVGLIIAFVGAIQLKSFGAGIYVSSMVTIGMTRIMAAIMVGIVMAGRTGSSFAATIGTMQVNEEIDALKTLGIKVSEYLVAPRIISLVITIPFLTLLADLLGILGGAIVGVIFLGNSPMIYFEYSIKALSLSNILIGLFHSLVYGFIISICGCYCGINSGRDADSVGKATTYAVVYALVWMIVATGIITLLLEVLGI